MNGKDLRVWTAVRPELQHVFMAAYDFVQSNVATNESSQPRRVNALDLAKALCDTYLNKPVTELVMDSEESLALRRVAAVMSTKHAEMVVPMKVFIQQQIKMPVSMHDVVRTSIIQFLGSRFRLVVVEINASRCVIYLPFSGPLSMNQ